MGLLLTRKSKRIKARLPNGWGFSFIPITTKSIVDNKGYLAFSWFRTEHTTEKRDDGGASKYFEDIRKLTQGKSDIQSMQEFILRESHCRYGKPGFMFKINDLDVEGYCAEDNELIVLERELICFYIVSKSFKAFPSPVCMERDHVIRLGDMAKTYGKSPIELIFSKNQYNELDAYAFNLFVHSEFCMHLARMAKNHNG